jgi:hypothetical protein
MRLLLGVLLAAVLGLRPATIEADRGVGVNLGRIDIEDRLSPGGGYNLPTLGVINTGDEAGEYEVVITYQHDQRQERPSQDWFAFQPQRFLLEAGRTQNVRILLTVPTGADAGDYFAFIEAHPAAEESGVSVGVAAATKLTFTVKPSGWLQAQQVRLNRWIDDSQPWSYLIPGAILLVGALLTLRRFFRIGLRIERR